MPGIPHRPVNQVLNIAVGALSKQPKPDVRAIDVAQGNGAQRPVVKSLLHILLRDAAEQEFFREFIARLHVSGKSVVRILHELPHQPGVFARKPVAKGIQAIGQIPSARPIPVKTIAGKAVERPKTIVVIPDQNLVDIEAHVSQLLVSALIVDQKTGAIRHCAIKVVPNGGGAHLVEGPDVFLPARVVPIVAAHHIKRGNNIQLSKAVGMIDQGSPRTFGVIIDHNLSARKDIQALVLEVFGQPRRNAQVVKGGTPATEAQVQFNGQPEVEFFAVAEYLSRSILRGEARKAQGDAQGFEFYWSQNLGC